MPTPIPIPISRSGSLVILLSCCIPTPVSRPESPTISSSCYLPALISYPGSSAVLSSHRIPVPISCLGSPAAPTSQHVPAPFPCLGSPIVLLSYYILTPAASAALFLSHYTFISCCGISAILLPLLVFCLPLFLISSSLRTFKQSLSDEPWPYILTSLAKPFCLFPTLNAYNLDDNNGLYNPTNNNKRKRDFNTTFINFCPLTGNHDQTERDLSFTGYGCFDVVKLIRLW